MKENAYIAAVKAMNTHIDNALAGTRDIEAIRKDLLEKSKEELVEMLIVHMRADTVKIESIARTILEDPTCAYLTYNEIAAGIASKTNSSTSDKSIASYASKKKADWRIVARKSNAERNAALLQLTGLN
jgi:hypothetical protein